MPAALWALTLRYWTSSSTIGPARQIRPNVAGMFSISIMRSACETSLRTPSTSSAAAWRVMPGMAAVAIDTPNSPIGRYINRKANPR